MKSKLTLSILLLFGILFQIKVTAQDIKLSLKPSLLDSKYLSPPDSLVIRQQLKTQNLSNNRTLVGQAELPYPIIFIHGLNSNSKVWVDLGTQLINNDLKYGGRIDFCLNDDGNNQTSNKLIYPAAGADIAYYTDYITGLSVADFYLLNFDVNNIGEPFPSDDGSPFNDVLSNEAAIAKQGVALKIAIQMVLLKTGKDKVVLMGHSMGGLAAREYLQNPINWQSDGNHHVAKLVTTGTPHGGFTGLGLSPTINFRSEAFRDLKKSYLISGDYSVYLSGGFENYSVMNNNLLYNFYNVDVNCNGIDADNTYVVGLNNKQWKTNLDYAYIVGVCTNCEQLQGTIEGDGIVRSENANLSNFTTQLPIPKNEFIYTAAASSLIGLHSDLPKAISVNMKGLDEPNEYNLAYGIELGKTYKGFTTVQPIGGYSYDIDDFTFNVVGTSQVNVNVTNISLANLMANIVDINGNSFGIFNSNGTNSISFSKTLPSGKYYFEIYGTPTTTSYLSPYTFSLTNTLSTNNFELSTAIKIFPNPTTSKVFFDNSIFNFQNVSVINSLGQEVSKNKFSTFLTYQEVDLSVLSAGVYVLKFSNTEISKTTKIVKQ
jgi:triacylglycerol esterase/lipase EstA (alpha/beta hydrolase family)